MRPLPADAALHLGGDDRWVRLRSASGDEDDLSAEEEEEEHDDLKMSDEDAPGEMPSALECDLLHLLSFSVAKGRLESESYSASSLIFAAASARSLSGGDLLLLFWDFASCAAFLLRFHFIRRFWNHIFT